MGRTQLEGDCSGPGSGRFHRDRPWASVHPTGQSHKGPCWSLAGSVMGAEGREDQGLAGHDPAHDMSHRLPRQHQRLVEPCGWTAASLCFKKKVYL